MASIELPQKHYITEFKPRFRDSDRMGHVNNAVFATYIEIARVEWWDGVRNRHNGNPMDFILGRLEIDYRAPIHLGDKISVAMWVTRFGNKSWEFNFKIFNKEKAILHAEAKTIQVGYDYKENKTMVINELARKYLSELYNQDR